MQVASVFPPFFLIYNIVLYESLINHVSYINTLYTDFKDKFMNESIKNVYGMNVGV